MSVKLQLQNLSDWLKDSAAATKGAAELTLESGLLKDSLKDLGELGGVAGALFKLGSRAIPDPSPEQRIASRLHQTFLTALDREFKEHPIEPGVWKRYLRDRLPEVTHQKLSGEFTWLSIFGSRGRKPGRSWPIVGELADLGRTWVADMATLEGRPTPVVHQLADDARGRIHEALAREIDRLQADPVVQQAMAEALSRVDREALTLLAQELTTLKKYRLFGEVAQDAVYISPRITITDLKEDKRVWWKEESTTTPGSEKLLFQVVREKHPRLFVLEGEMGVGKSCLMRVLGSLLAEQFRRDHRHPPIYIRWRDIYNETDLDRAISDQLAAEYGLPFRDLPDQDDLVYLVDGFDEMSSHQEAYVSDCFNRLIKLGRGRCSVVVAMRSTVITPNLRRVWKTQRAVVVQVQEFDRAAVDNWALKWTAETGDEVSGDRLRSLCAEPDESVVHNPLLLYMLAKYVDPAARERERLSRTELFRIFVDETIRGKLRTSHEEFPFQFSEQEYRMLLQEIAWLASWPVHAPKCPSRLIRERIPESFLKDLNFQDIRTAFVLHFFEPGDLAGNEFEFQPEGFRQYLLAEWCVRAQFEALCDGHRLSHLSRAREKAMDALAQLHLKEEERNLLKEIYEELGELARQDQDALARRLENLGIRPDPDAAGLLHRLYERVRDHAEIPPDRAWEDEKVGVPKGEEVPAGLDSLRRLVNYWDQCILATIAVYRGLEKDPMTELAFERDPKVLGRFLRTRDAVRGRNWEESLDLSYFPLPKSDLVQVILESGNLEGANLSEADLRGAFLNKANLSEANLTGADLRRADLTGANLFDAVLDEADFSGAKVDPGGFRLTLGQPRRLPDASKPSKSW